MSPAFAKGVQNYFPWAKVTYDNRVAGRWHVFKLLGKHLEKLADQHPTKRAYVMLLQEHLSDFYGQSCLDTAQAQLCFMADLGQELFGKNSFTKSIRKHFNGIVEHIRSQLTNGLLEGINRPAARSKIQTIKRVAKGFRYTDNFKKMILFVFAAIKPQCNTT